MFVSFVTGFLTSFSLILAIGAQNAFILRQGLMRAHVFWLCLFAGVSDAILIVVGVAGFGSIVDVAPGFPRLMALVGAAFLLVYGGMRFRAAWRGDYGMALSGQPQKLWPALATLATLTWANPHVYLDTLGLIGAVSAQFDGALRIAFTIGAVLASCTFFFMLGFGARFLAPLMQSAANWRVLDALIGVLMWVLAAGLIIYA